MSLVSRAFPYCKAITSIIARIEGESGERRGSVPVVRVFVSEESECNDSRAGACDGRGDHPPEESPDNV